MKDWLIEAVESRIEGIDTFDAADKEALAMYLADTRRLLEAVKLLESTVEAKLIPMLPYGASLDERTITGVGVLEVKGGRTHKVYDNPMVISGAAMRIAKKLAEPHVDLGTGEIEDRSQFQVEDAIDWFVKLAGITPSFNSWRKGPAQELGLDLDQHMTRSEPSAYRVVIRGQ